MYTVYLKENEMISENHFPVIALLNEAANSDIVEFVNNLNQGIGSGFDYSDCTFWNELDEYDKSNIPHYEGLLFSTEDDDEVIVGYSDLLIYLNIICEKLQADNYSRIIELNEQINLFRRNYLKASS